LFATFQIGHTFLQLPVELFALESEIAAAPNHAVV